MQWSKDTLEFVLPFECYAYTTLRITLQLTVVPANERSQFRWTGNPFDLTGGSGLQEFDTGPWMLPYWMARFYGLIIPSSDQSKE